MTVKPDKARNAAAEAADQIRIINHATQHVADFRVCDVYTISADLAALQRRFRQAAEQLAAVLTSRLERGDLRHDAGGDVEDAVMTARDRLAHVGDLADRAGQLLELAQNALAPIADRGDLTVAPGLAVDHELTLTTADVVLHQWSDQRSADIGSAPASPSEGLDR
jgi:hypothetical protein